MKSERGPQRLHVPETRGAGLWAQVGVTRSRWEYDPGQRTHDGREGLWRGRTHEDKKGEKTRLLTAGGRQRWLGGAKRCGRVPLDSQAGCGSQDSGELRRDRGSGEATVFIHRSDHHGHPTKPQKETHPQ